MPGVYAFRIDTTDAILAHIRPLGYHVSGFHNTGSLFGRVPAFIEMHAVTKERQELARVFVEEHVDSHYSCACLLAEMVGIDLEA